MSKFNSSKPKQLIDGGGEFNTGVGRELDFGNDRGLVGVVSIMGVQSSGKSTLMNKCFSTKFIEMNEDEGMTQTTKGISISKVSFSDARVSHKILLLDCEGSDGFEREQEGREVFEKQVTLFALASSDVVLINMKCDNVNLKNGASMPLIRNVFEVMVRKFNTPRRVTLLFVLRDKNKAPLEKLRDQLIHQLAEIWNKVREDLTTPYVLDEFFKVEVVALSHYQHREEAFLMEVARLRERIFHVVKKGTLSQAANFISFTQKNWIDIQEDKVLNLQLNKNSADNEFFMKLKEDIIRKFSQNKEWINMKEFVRQNVAKNFSYFVTSRMEGCLFEFDEETKSFNKKSKDDFRAQLTACFLEIVDDTYHSLVENEKNALLECLEEDIEEKVEDGNDDILDPRAFIKVFQQFLLDARIMQDSRDRISEPVKDLEFRMNQLVDSALHIIQQRKMLESQERSELMAAGGVVASSVTSGVEATDNVFPGPGTPVEANAGGIHIISALKKLRKGKLRLQESNISDKLSTSGSKRSP